MTDTAEQTAAAAPAEAAKTEAPAEVKKNPLERTLELSISVADKDAEVEKRLKAQAKTARMDGFRRGHVPMAQVRAMYGFSIEQDVLNDMINAELNKLVRDGKILMAGVPAVAPKDKMADATKTLEFVATYEVLPEVKIPDFSGVEFKRFTCPVTDAEVDQTTLVMRKQRATYTKVERACGDTDRVTIDFKGTKDGVEFEGGKAEGFVFILGEGQMLPDFEMAVKGMAAGESKTFPLTFPKDYGTKDLAGAEVQFEVTLKDVFERHLPEFDDAFAKTLGVNDGAEKMLKEIRANLEREVEARLLNRTKAGVMDAVLAAAKDLDLPQCMVAEERESLVEAFKQQLKSQGMDVEKFNPPADAFRAEAEQRVRLGLVLPEIARSQKITATEEAVKALATKIAAAYEQPEKVAEYFLKDGNERSRLSANVIENAICEWILAQGKTTEQAVPFNELMAQR